LVLQVHVRSSGPASEKSKKDDGKDTRTSLGGGDNGQDRGRLKRCGLPRADMHGGKDRHQGTKSQSGLPPARRSRRSPERLRSRPLTRRQEQSIEGHPSPEPEQRPEKPDMPPTPTNNDDELNLNLSDEETNQVSKNKVRLQKAHSWDENVTMAGRTLRMKMDNGARICTFSLCNFCQLGLSEDILYPPHKVYRTVL
jgi:hypothetical protein